MRTSESPKILLISASGFLGYALSRDLKSLGASVTSAGRYGQDITLDLAAIDQANLEYSLQQGQFDLGIICSAVSDIDTCFKNQEYSHQVNVRGTIQVLDLFKKNRIKPVFFSSDLVFGNQRDWYTESDPVQPTTIYGIQKAQVEEYILTHIPETVIFRTSKLMSTQLLPRNILTPIFKALLTEQRAKLFVDQFISPLYIEDVSQALLLAYSNNLQGIFHLSNNQRFSRWELGVEVANFYQVPLTNFDSAKIGDMNFCENRGSFFTINSSRFSLETGYSFTPLLGSELFEKKLPEIKFV